MTPGYPGNPLPPQRRPPLVVEAERTPPSMAPGEVQFRGHGWRLSLPTVVLTGFLSALGARLLPTQNPQDADARAEQRLEAIRNAEFREEMRRALSVQSDRQSRLETELSSLRISVDATKKQVEKLEGVKP